VPHRHEADAEPLRQRRAEDEAARLDAHDQLRLVRDDALGQQIGHGAEGRPVAEQRRHVLEEDARLREIGYVANPRQDAREALVIVGWWGVPGRRRHLARR
jgi:hypothetical protein